MLLCDAGHPRNRAEALAGNPHLYEAVLTGILRVARASIFSGLDDNPWSVLNFLRWQYQAQPYWLSTSDNVLIERLFERHAGQLQPLFEMLLAGGGFERPVDENVVLAQLDHRPDALWQALAEGLAQLQQQGYATELKAAGATPIHAFAVAFDGKQVRVATADRPS